MILNHVVAKQSWIVVFFGNAVACAEELWRFQLQRWPWIKKLLLHWCHNIYPHSCSMVPYLQKADIPKIGNLDRFWCLVFQFFEKMFQTWQDQGGWWQNTEAVLSSLSGTLKALTSWFPVQEHLSPVLKWWWWINLVERGGTQKFKEELIIPENRFQRKQFQFKRVSTLEVANHWEGRQRALSAGSPPAPPPPPPPCWRAPSTPRTAPPPASPDSSFSSLNRRYLIICLKGLPLEGTYNLFHIVPKLFPLDFLVFHTLT